MTKILVVDDEPGIRDLLVEVLQDEGYTAAAAHNGQEALESLATERPALVLLDIMMPILDGRQVLRQMRERPDWRDIPIIIMTAGIFTYDDAPNLASLPKPFNLDQLLTTIDRLLQPSRAHLPDRVRD